MKLPLQIRGTRATSVRTALRKTARRLPLPAGALIHVSFRPQLTVHRDKLLSSHTAGEAVHAAAFIRRRRIVLDSELLENCRELSRILIHELFHFQWARLGNPARRSWEALLDGEIRSGARGELGWSAQALKRRVEPVDARKRSQLWRWYCCESFCDTAAWRFLQGRSHAEWTLAPRFRSRRREWMDNLLAGGVKL